MIEHRAEDIPIVYSIEHVCLMLSLRPPNQYEIDQVLAAVRHQEVQGRCLAGVIGDMLATVWLGS